MKIIFLIMISVGLSLASEVRVDNKTGLMWQDNSGATVQWSHNFKFHLVGIWMNRPAYHS